MGVSSVCPNGNTNCRVMQPSWYLEPPAGGKMIVERDEIRFWITQMKLNAFYPVLLVWLCAAITVLPAAASDSKP